MSETHPFDPARLAQARTLAGLSARRLAELVGIAPAALGQCELGARRPSAQLLARLADALDVPAAYFAPGRPHGRVDASAAHFRSLRETRAHQRAKAAAFTELAWELTHALERRVELPAVDLPGFSCGEFEPGALPAEPAAAARELRGLWGLGDGPVTHLVRRLEARGVVVLFPRRDADLRTVDAFSTSRLTRPIIVLTANKADDVHRHRFSAAHELGHLVLHGEASPGDVLREREADAFAAEFLTPAAVIGPLLPERADVERLAELRAAWGVSADALVRRSRELGLISEAAAGRAVRRLHALRGEPGFAPDPVAGYPGEQPALLREAFALSGLTAAELAAELAWHPPRVRELLGEQRPALTLVPGGG